MPGTAAAAIIISSRRSCRDGRCQRAPVTTMTRPKENKAREDRIAMEAVVDAYNESERAMGWYCYLEGKIKPPFAAKCVVRRSISPLKVDQVVTVLGMAPEAECETEMFVLIEYNDDTLAVPIAQLDPASPDPETQEAFADWHYWLARGYEF